jgi:two-component system response regulator FlrC
LDNLLQRALILVNGPVIHKEHIQFELANEGHGAEPVTLAVTPAALDTATTGSFAAITNSASAPSASSLARSLDQTERDLILDALRCGQGSRRAVAERLGISQRTLRYKLARLREAGVDVPAA